MTSPDDDYVQAAEGHYGPVLTNLFIIPVLYYTLRYFSTFYLSFIYYVLMYTISNAYHVCLFFAQTQCFWSMNVVAHFDSTLAEGSALVAAIDLCMIENLRLKQILQIVAICLHVFINLAYDLKYVSVGVAAAIGLFALLYRWRELNKYFWFAGFAFVVSGLVAFQVGSDEHYPFRHSFWHTLIFLGLGLWYASLHSFLYVMLELGPVLLKYT